MNIEFIPSEKSHAFGHHFIVGLSGPVLAREDKEILKRLRPIGVYVSSRNFSQNPSSDWYSMYQHLISEAHKYTEREKVLTLIDFEVGALPAPFRGWPVANDPFPHEPEALDYLAKAVRSLGVNAWLAPRIENGVQSGEDSSHHAQIESLLRALQQFQREGILGCVRYFPGYDGISRGLREPIATFHSALPQHVLEGYRYLASHNVKIIVASNHIYTQFDPVEPAVFSERTIRGVLRDSLGYQGVVMSDDVDTLAVAERFDRGLGAPCAVRASVDLLLVSRLNNPYGGHALRIAQSMYDSLRAHQVSEDLLFNSFRRIQRLMDEVAGSGLLQPMNAETINRVTTLLGTQR